ncbi:MULTISPECIES: tyrosine-type recombinase/integrase [Bacillus]|uniref:tyrosine-type recombinase/integrase n=1 Tax=Bacillus TaxID=1386 RepID=UPI0002D78117|nr:tyrosine-type recombinase/integrase [Bacillus pseudomycoides]MED1596354.1 tyrosine-type recombinase/integrase [Bacillus pseudomycoides]MED4710149.1 tyrosine-type recombinase/integrase [Bacillus pseudomycoides]OOR54311.1 transposase [Bacillus pseudomycoides]PDY10323.1 transposase [Bacillus pseudomycoides]PEJ39069.1 transposase [Bacillus pseudomycoides]
MRVQEVLLENNSKRYILVDNEGIPVIPVMKYLKYLDVTGKSNNTQKTYCYALKQYFLYLQEIEKNYRDIRLEDLVEFVGWLRNPYESSKVMSLRPVKAKKTERTVNLTVTAVTNFYDYLYRNEELPRDMKEKLIRQVFTGGRTRYKSFLHHINQDKLSMRNVLKVKEPRKRVQTLSKEQVKQVLAATTNIRDTFLIQLLFETGLRIGETLSLFLEDFKFSHQKGHRIRLTDRGELENGAKLKTGEREIFVSQDLMDLYDDYMYDVIDELDVETNFVFVKLRGKNMGRPMTYGDVEALFKRLRQKTGIDVHPHLFRHTHATMYYQETKDIKQVQERLGHSQIQTTMNLYLHPSDEDIRKDWEKAQGAFQIKEPNGGRE